MVDRKDIRRRLTQLKNEHFKLDKLVLHMTAQASESSKKMDPTEQNRLKEFKKRKLALRDEIVRIERDIQSSYKR
mgnify:CR=1 FL=1